MRTEILNTALTETGFENSSGNGDLEKVKACLAEILEKGKDPADVVRQIWTESLREELPLSKTSVVVDKLINGLPEDMRRDLMSIVGKGGITPLSLAREKAEKQVENERNVVKPSRGMAKHIRRMKANKRREDILSKP